MDYPSDNKVAAKIKEVTAKRDVDDVIFHLGYLKGALSREKVREAIIERSDDQNRMRQHLDDFDAFLAFFHSELRR